MDTQSAGAGARSALQAAAPSRTKSAASAASAAKAAKEAFEQPAAKAPVMASGLDVKPLDIGTRLWHVTAKADHTLDDVKHPAYLWARALRVGRDGVKPGELVIVTHETHAFCAILYVVRIDAGAHAVICHPVLESLLDKSALPKPDLSGARIENKGINKWCVILGSDYLSKGHATEEHAEAWLEKKRTE